MHINIGKVKLSAGFSFFASAAFFLAAGMYENYICCMIFSSLHELGHIIPLKYMGCQISEISLGGMGIRIGKSRCVLSYRNECVAALCGPVVNAVFMLIFFFLKKSNDIFILPFNINSGLFIINMLPVKMLDGGRFINSLLLMRYDEEYVHRVLTFLEVLTSVVLIVIMIVTLYMDIVNTSFVFFVFTLVIIIVLSAFNAGKCTA